MPDDFCYELCVTECPSLSNSTLVGEKGTKKLAAYGLLLSFEIFCFFTFADKAVSKRKHSQRSLL